LGERAAKRQLKKGGLKFLYANFSSEHGEIDLIFREGKTLVFVEVKTRSSESWARPAAAVNADKQRKLIATARDYLHLLRHSNIPYRFDIVEVLLVDGRVNEVRHQPNAFAPGRRRR
jgi:putative endonuclease